MNQATLDDAVRDVQQVALDYVLAKDLPPEAGKEIGGSAALLQAIDKVRANPTGSAGLDAVMTTVTALKRAGKNPETEFNAAAQSIANQGAAK
jgi:hypothetical protein